MESPTIVSASFDETFDYLTLLGLDPAALEVQPPGEVRNLINRRKKEWTGQAINPLFQQQARANLERARQFEKILDSPDALQAYLGFHEAAGALRRQQHEATIGELVALAAGSGRREITAEQHGLLLKACEELGIPNDALDGALRTRRLGISTEESIAPTGGAPYRHPALDRTLLAQIAGHLRLLGKESFYELLDLPAAASPAKVISTARILYDRWSKTLPKTSDCVAWEKSLQACLTYLKDGPSKARYDNALYNRRLDDFLSRVDLVLAAGRFTRDDFILMARIGVEEFGLTNEIVNHSVRWRAGTRGLSLSKPVQINVSTSGLVKCQRCSRFVPDESGRCRHCGSAFDQRCRNPACSRPLSAGVRVCEHCGLAAARGVQYLELLRLASALVAAGESRGAIDACRLAEQVLPSPQVEELVVRAGKIRTLAASIRRAASDRRWVRVERELADLLTLAPRFAQPGCPRLEEVSRFLKQLRGALLRIPADAEPEAEARICLEVLEKWSDSDETLHRLRRLVDALEMSGRNEPALEIVQRLAALEPLSEEWQVRTVRLQHKQMEERAQIDRIAEVQEQFRQSLAAGRLYAAERALTELDELGACDLAIDVAESLRKVLSEVREELSVVREATQAGASADELIARHLNLLERCRDCRESLVALQALTPLAPGQPTAMAVSVQGTKRVVTWQRPGAGSPATGYVVERSAERSGTRPREAMWSTVFDGPASGFVDDEVLHAGTIVRYSVHAIRRGALTVAGSVLKEFAVPSLPIFTEPMLLWQDVLGLRVRRLPNDSDVELNWHIPAGARQVFVERWIGGRDERPERPELLHVPASNRLLINPPDHETPVSFRIYCVYDGPAGDFTTPGSIVTLVPGGEPTIESALEPDDDDAPIPEFTDILAQAPAAGHASHPTESNNPLKRMGLWPPAPRKM